MYPEKTKLHAREKNRDPQALKTIVLDVTGKCNMRCAHCYAEPFFESHPIEPDILGSALDEAYDMGVTHYVLMGGEPILDPRRLEFILQRCRVDESYITVTTNGWGMTEPKILWLKELGVDKLSPSLDSGIEVEHDANRCPESFQRVMQMVDDALAAGLIVAIAVTVTHESLYSEGFKRAFAYAVNKGIRLDLQIAEPVGNWEGNQEVLITPKDAAFIKQLQMNGPRTANGEPTIKRDIFSGKGDHCPAGTDFMHISVAGDVFPCNFLQYSLGNIRDRSLRQMREDLLAHPLFANVTAPKCLCGEDAEFFEKYMKPYVGQPKPLDAYEVFDLPCKAKV